MVEIPQLKKIPGSNKGKLRFHKRGHEQLLVVFADIEKLNLLHHIKTCAGAFYARLKKPTSNKLSKEPSNHSFGIAIDLNADDGSLGSTVAPVAPIFQSIGFKWGKSFHDPMHFEVLKFIDHPKSTVQDVKVFVDNVETDIGAQNLKGSVYAQMSKAFGSLGLKGTPTSQTKVLAIGESGSATLDVLKFGDLTFLPLPLLAGVANKTMEYNNSTKTARLIKVPWA